MKMKEQREKERLLPEIERFKQLIDSTHKSIADNEASIEKENQKTIDLEDHNAKQDNNKDELREQFDTLHNQYQKLKDEPNRLGKGNENLQIAVNHLRNELDSLKKDTENSVTHEA